MQRNTETLSTRDLASPNEQADGDTTSRADAREAAPEAQSAVYDPETPVAQGTGLPVDEQKTPPGEARTAVSPRDQSVEVARPDAGLDTDSGGPGHAAVNTPATSTQAVSTQDRDAEAASPPTSAPASASNADGSLLPADMDATFQERWKEIQTRFVDEPRGAVEDADSLVANLMQQLAEGFAKERERLEAQWGRGEDISTEDLRVALQRYRTFFQRLLST